MFEWFRRMLASETRRRCYHRSDPALCHADGGTPIRSIAGVLGQSAAWSTAVDRLLMAGPGQSVKMKA
jgi:hypothetical protein